jgi:integrase
MPKELTAPAIDKLKPGRKRYAKRVSRNLYVIVQPGGSKSWAARFGGEKLVLGPVDSDATGEPAIGQPLTLHGAKQLAAQVLRERNNLGRDPVAEHRAAKQRRWTELKQAEANAFGILVRQYADEHARPKNRKWRYTLKQLGLDYPKDGDTEPVETTHGLAQRWRERDVRTIEGSDIFSVVDEARRRGTPGLARRKKGLSEGRGRDLHTALGSMFGWLHENRFVTANPCIGVKRPSSGQARDRWLNNDEIIRFWRGCDAIHPTFAAVFRLLLLTGCRLREISEMRRTELQENELHLPGTRTKNKKPHLVPLSPLALSIINAMPRIEGCPYVFTTNGKTPISGWSKIKRQLAKAMANPEPWRLHDLRHTAATGMNKLGIRPDVIELAVNHVSGVRGGIAGRYNHDAMMPERKAALLRWSQHIAGLVSDAPSRKVVSLRSR